MKFYKYVVHTISPELKEAWDLYGKLAGTGNKPPKPGIKGPSPKVIISNVKLPGAQRWSPS